MAVLNIPCIRSSVLNWTNDQGFAEHSSIRIPLFNRIYNDACDAGFAVCSDKSGQIAIFAHYDTDMDQQDEAGWHFVCIGLMSKCGKFIRRKPELSNINIVIIND